MTSSDDLMTEVPVTSTGRPWLVGLASGFGYLVFLTLSNLGLVRAPIIEDGDFAANSILVDRALDGRLLIGNYSRVGFNHPGPAILDAQAAGQVAFHQILPLSPSPYGGQFLGVLCLNALCVGLASMIVYRAARRWEAAVALPIAMLAIGSWTSYANASTWMPHAYIAPFVLLVAASASVATGKWRDLWILALAGGLLVHGHVSFLLFVGVTGTVAVVAGWYLTRRRAEPTDHLRRDLIWAAVVSAAMLAPIVANLVLHWPGELRKYADYMSDRTSFQPRSVRDVADFVFQYWTGGSAWWSVALVAALVATVAAWRHQRSELRVFLVGLGAICGLEVALMVFYTFRGVDDLQQVYIGLFSYSGPVWVLTAGMVSVACLARRPAARAATGVALLAVALLVASSGEFGNPYRGQPAASAFADRVETAGLVRVDFSAQAWPAALALVEDLRRRDVPVCVVNPWWTFMVTPAMVCDAEAPDDSTTVAVRAPGEPVDGTVLQELNDLTLVEQ